jgi:hypothetical protein
VSGGVWVTGGGPPAPGPSLGAGASFPAESSPPPPLWSFPPWSPAPWSPAPGSDGGGVSGGEETSELSSARQGAGSPVPGVAGHPAGRESSPDSAMFGTDRQASTPMMTSGLSACEMVTRR